MMQFFIVGDVLPSQPPFIDMALFVAFFIVKPSTTAPAGSPVMEKLKAVECALFWQSMMQLAGPFSLFRISVLPAKLMAVLFTPVYVPSVTVMTSPLDASIIADLMSEYVCPEPTHNVEALAEVNKHSIQIIEAVSFLTVHPSFFYSRNIDQSILSFVLQRV